MPGALATRLWRNWLGSEANKGTALFLIPIVRGGLHSSRQETTSIMELLRFLVK